MAKPVISTKRLAISRANAQMVAVVGVASFVTVFCLVASKSVISQNQYVSRVLVGKEQAHRDLRKNLDTYDALKSTYDNFDNDNPNIIGGQRVGKDDRDGSNSKVVLDSLPRTYDFPALTSSVEKVLADQKAASKHGGYTIEAITGTDEEVGQQTTTSSPKPEPVQMPFTFSIAKAHYDDANALLSTFERSTRPIQIDSLRLSGGTNSMKVRVSAHTYYQPSKNVKITTKVQK